MAVRKPAFIALATILILVYFASRLMYLGAFPVFIDEAFHVNAAKEIMQTGPLRFADEGKQFTHWLFLVLGTPAGNSVWLGRALAVIASTISLSVIMRFGRDYGGIQGIIFAGLLGIFSAYHFLIERLALTDAFSVASIMLAILFTAQLRRRIDMSTAILTGIALIFAVGFKVASLPYLGIPLAGVVACYPRWRNRTTSLILWGTITYALLLVLITTYAGVLGWRGYNLFGLINVHNQGQVDYVVLASNNIVDMAQRFIGYWGVPFVALVALSIVWSILRRRWFFPLVILAPLAVYVLNQTQTARYWLASATLMIIVVVVTVAPLLKHNTRRTLFAVFAIFVWGATTSMPIWVGMNQASPDIPLPYREYNEYVAGDASGYGFSELAQYLRDTEATRIIGLLSSCNGLQYTAPHLPIECPRILLDGSAIPDHEALIAGLMGQKGVFVVLENSPYVPDTIDAPRVYQASRPTGLATLSVYHLGQ